jgi:ribosomal RNA assembly protein
MSFEKLIRIPNDRIGALIGKSGSVKSKIEEACYVSIDVDGDTGEVFIKSIGSIEKMQPFKAMEIVSAIGRGFSPENAMTLLEDENILHVIDLREFAGKSNANVERIKGRIIGNSNKLKLAVDAICAISSGGMHGAVYDKLESANRRTKQEKMLLWENQDVLY